MQIAEDYNIIVFLVALITLLIIAGIIEYYNHYKSLRKLPIRIHVNGTRGKSSVARLIAAGMRAGGLRTYAKTISPRSMSASCRSIRRWPYSQPLLHRQRQWRMRLALP